jgi:UDP-glucose:tetrahydrobiopterin glucosyltransferase
MKLLFLSTPVGPLGSGVGGGVELTLLNLAQEMVQRGHEVRVVAPQGSVLEVAPLTEVPGSQQTMAQAYDRTSPIVMPANSTLGNMWDYARQVQDEYDLLVNFAYDWLPFYLTPFLRCSIAHFVSMGSLSDAMDQVVEQVGQQFPGTIGVYTRSQALTFPQPNLYHCLGSGVDLQLYEFCPTPVRCLAWIGRIAQEKALEDAVAAAQQTGILLKVLGKMQEQDYWDQVMQQYPDAPVKYVGFLPTQQMQQELRECMALLMTPRWVEAFGNVAIEALACGVPVISYERGGPSEIIHSGKTGWLVEPDSVSGLVAAISRLDQIDRQACRHQAETEFSLTALGDRFEQWFQAIVKRKITP